VKEKEVECKGCRKWIKLGKIYGLKDWETHKTKCPQITGKETVCIRAVSKPKVHVVSPSPKYGDHITQSAILSATSCKLNYELFQTCRAAETASKYCSINCANPCE
jgi:hypothetical protein